MRHFNILLIHSDQHRYDSVGANGNPIVKTPNLDRLAAEGVRFTHAFTPCPVCTPARASLMTGAWPTRHGSLDIPTSEIRIAADPELPVLTRLMKDAGFRTGWVGKFHAEVQGRPEDHGVDRYCSSSGYRAWREGQGLPPVTRNNRLFGDPDWDCPSDKGPLAWQCDRVIEMIDEAADAGEPFFLRWDPPQPHLPCAPTKDFLDLYRPEAIPPWPSFGESFENKPPVQKRQQKIWGVEDWEWEDWSRIVALYFAEITEMDHNIGRVLEALTARGLLDETLVIYSTDHGDYCGGHRQIDKHFSLYDDLVRVPLMLRFPSRIEAGTVCESFSSNELDIARTILEFAGINPPDTFVGKNLIELASGKDPGRPDIFAQYFGGETGLYSIRMIRDRRFKFVYNPTSIHEFYDLTTDPGELVNRIDDPSWDTEIRRMKRRLAEWMSDIDDRLWKFWIECELTDGASEAEKAGLARSAGRIGLRHPPG